MKSDTARIGRVMLRLPLPGPSGILVQIGALQPSQEGLDALTGALAYSVLGLVTTIVGARFFLYLEEA
jgi:hypothetical protein